MSGLSEEQQNIVQWYKGPMLVLGTPGSGKTTVIVNRICYLIDVCKVNPANILCFTFTRAAAASMRTRFLSIAGDRGRDVRFGTFHSFFYWIINTAYGGKGLGVLDETKKKDMIRNILLDINKDFYDNDEIILSAINQLGRISSDMISVNDYYSHDMPEHDFRLMYKRYNEEKARLGVLDFDDMVSKCYELLTEREDIRQRIHQLYPYILVDEFQDTNLIQYKILKMLAAPDNNIFAVGDDDQSIYGFRGARPDIMLSFSKEFENAEIMTLSTNFRCPEVVTELSSKIIGRNKKRYDKALKSAVKDRGRIYFSRPEDIRKENELLIRRIEKAHDAGTAYKDIAVLYRTNMDPRRLIYKLRENGIPFSVRDVIPDIFSQYIVQPILNYIHFAMGDNRRSLFLTFMNKPVRYIKRNMLPTERVGLKELLQEASDQDYLKTNIIRLANELDTIRRLNPFGAISYIRKAVGYDKYLKEYAAEHNLDYEEMIDVLDEVQGVAREFDTYDSFIEYIESYQKLLKEQKEASENTFHKNKDRDEVQLMTMHSAKGLEFSEVHIIECVDGVMPHKKSRSEAEIEEERRMLYVSVTRTKDALYIYSPRMSGDKALSVSGFLTDIEGFEEKE